MNLFSWIRHWLSKWRIASKSFFRPMGVIAIVESADEIPDFLPDRGAVLVLSGGRKKWLAFDCPCGSGHRIMLNLDSARKPFWTITSASSKRLSIRPSVDFRGDNRRCHYVVRNGNIHWT